MKRWEEFEQAVAAFVAAIDPKAIVKSNVRLPDHDTGRLRQRDIWVEAVFGGIFPVSILISCKRLRRKLNEQDMDAFVGELLSSGAHKGVLYSYLGFTVPAVAKAKAKGITCCRLYEDQPADLPESLLLSFYCCCPSFRVSVNTEALAAWGDTKFSDLFQIPAADGRTTLEFLVNAFGENEKAAIEDGHRAKKFPRPWKVSVQLRSSESPIPLILSLQGKWRVYRAKLEAHLLNGTYSLTDRKFMGSQSSPWIDRLSSQPGPDWELLPTPPDALAPASAVIILSRGNVKERLESMLSNKVLRELP